MAEVMKYIDKKETKTFLCEQVKRRNGHYLCYYDTLGYFFKNMPEEERFEFVKKTFIDKTDLSAFYEHYEYSYNWYIKPYQWYEFAPFDVALTEFKKLIRKEHPPSERIAMLSVLITCARRSQKHIKTLLQVFKEKYIKESFKFKIEFVNNMLSQVSTYECDVETWNVLDQLFHSMEVYTESNNNVQLCLESIIVYKVLHNKTVPVIIEQKMTFYTFDKIQSKLNKEQNSKMFSYLFNSVLKKIQSENIVNVSNLVQTIVQLKNALTLIKDWKKDISDYPFVLDKIQQLIQIRQDNMWKTDMSCLYNVKKSWRQHMFEESLSLSVSEEACLNALKHKPQLLTRLDNEIDSLRTDDVISLRRLLAKLRVYWPHTLAQHWTDAYLLHLNKPTGQKAVVRGLFSLLHQRQIIEMANKYRPDYSKVNWNETDQNEISIRQNIAKHLHVARPLIPLDTILWLATGEYLQHAVPSLNAVLSNMSEVESHEHLAKLLEAPVSLQKFGLHLAAKKLKHDDRKRIFLKIWKTSKNSSIRSALVKHIYIQISHMAHNLSIQKELWEVLSSFIDNLSEEESAEIYKTFGNIKNVNIGIRGEFYMKSYEFLTTLPASANCENYVKDLIEYAPKIMDSLDEDFVANKMLSPVGTKFCFYESEVLEIFACYVLCGKTEEDQLQRFRRVVEPAMSEAFQLWGSTRAGHFYVKDNFKKFLGSLIWNFRIYFLTKNNLPVKLFVELKNKIGKELPLFDNYVLYTSWKLITEYVKVMDLHKSVLSKMFDPSSFNELDFGNKKMSKEMENIWIDIHYKIAPTLGPMIVKCLKEDTEQYNIPTIYCPFAEAFERMFNDFSEDEEFMLETLNHMLDDKDFYPSYFLVSKATPKYVTSDMKKIICKIRLEIRAKLDSHPSSAVRLHYYNDFRKFPRHSDFE